jgi:hypothetical protein
MTTPSISASPPTSIGAARDGMQRGLSQVARAAQSIAKGEINSQNSTDLIEGQRTMESSARVLQSSNEKIGTLLDVTA